MFMIGSFFEETSLRIVLPCGGGRNAGTNVDKMPSYQFTLNAMYFYYVCDDQFTINAMYFFCLRKGLLMLCTFTML